MSDPIQKFVEDFFDIKDYLDKEGQFSASININEHYRKVLLLSCASFYETQIQNLLKELIKEKSNSILIENFMCNKAINRQYHTYFNWDSKNINNFLGLFGAEFSIKISLELKNDFDLNQNMLAFIEIGKERNKMVHENFLEYRLDKTFDEIYGLHKKAYQFIMYLRRAFELPIECNDN